MAIGDGHSVPGVTIRQVTGTTAEQNNLLASPVLRIEATQSPRFPVELRINAPDSRWIVYRDETLGLWIPVETQREGGELVAQIDHLSEWSTISEGVDFLATQLFRFLGDRALPPECTGTVPTWVSSFDTEPGNHPRLLACHGGQENEATLSIRNNRGYPLWVAFSSGSSPVSARTIHTDTPDGLDELLRIGFGKVLGRGRTYLAPGGPLTAAFTQPQSPPRTGRIEVHGTLDPPLVGFHMIMEALAFKGLVDLPVGDGTMLGVKALECYGKVPWASVGSCSGTC